MFIIEMSPQYGLNKKIAFTGLWNWENPEVKMQRWGMIAIRAAAHISELVLLICSSSGIFLVLLIWQLQTQANTKASWQFCILSYVCAGNRPAENTASAPAFPTRVLRVSGQTTEVTHPSCMNTWIGGGDKSGKIKRAEYLKSTRTSQSWGRGVEEGWQLNENQIGRKNWGELGNRQCPLLYFSTFSLVWLLLPS